jgi:hypothetical protein
MTPAEIDAKARKQQEAVDRLSVRLRAKAAEIIKRFEGRSFTAAEVFQELENMWLKSIEFQKSARQLKNISKDEIKAADYNMINLGELRALVKSWLKSPTRHAPGSDIWRKARDFQVAPILWLERISRPVLQRQIAYERMASSALNVPGQAVRYVLEQARQGVTGGLGLPGWFIPTLAGAGIIAIGLRLYLGFVEPVLPPARLRRRDTVPT